MNEQATTVRVRDLPTRIFHWTLASAVATSIGSAWLGGNALIRHFRIGYAVFAWLAFRVLWGLVGGHWSRFATFACAPAATLRSLRSLRGRSLPHEHHEVGHSPLGAFSVFALPGVRALQVATGLFADDQIADTGPLNSRVSKATGLAPTRSHKNVGQWLIIAPAALLPALCAGLVGWVVNLAG